MPAAVFPEAVRGVIEALVIGFLIGAQREASHGERHAGVRDFVLIALVGGICGLLQNPWLTVASLVAITALLGVFYFHIRERTGITTEMAAVATFCLGFLTATPDNPLGEPLAIGTAVAVVAFLEAKRSIHKLIREVVTEAEFNDTLRYLATIFIIYPILPDGRYGPYDFFSPRTVWVFVILVSSVSYVGYFFQKFLGAHRGLGSRAFLAGSRRRRRPPCRSRATLWRSPESSGCTAGRQSSRTRCSFPACWCFCWWSAPRWRRRARFHCWQWRGAGFCSGR